MNPQEVLGGLRDLQLPAEPVPGVAAAFVWWPLAVFLVASAAGAALWYRRRTAWRREVAAELYRLRALAGDPAARSQAWADLATLLRRIALLIGGERHPAAYATGTAWLAALDALFGHDRFRDAGRALLDRPYLRPGADNGSQLREIIELVRQSIGTRRRPAGR